MSKKSSIRSDKELEDLLRKISDSAEIPYSEEDWKDMESRLDQMPSVPLTGTDKKGLLWAGVVLFLALVSLVTWTQLPIHTGEDQTEPQVTRSEQMKESGDAGSGGFGSSPTEVKKNQSEVGTKTTPASPPAGFTEIRAYSTSTAGSPGVTGKQEPSPGQMDAGNLEITNWDGQESLAFQIENNPMPILDFGSWLPAELALKEEHSGKILPEKSDKNSFGFAGRFSLSIQAAPDLSGIEMNQVSKAGQAFGIGMSYFLKPRLSISSGVFYSFKPYSSNGENQPGYGKKPEQILGECDILDIPINLRYYPLEGKVQRAFASIGFSSYLMLEEYYRFDYQDPVTGYPYSDEIRVNGANNHFFGVVNISAGYERKLGKQLSLQVEPYFKVPINGVGEGDISLKSTGIFVGLNFYPGGKSVK